jgi:hypothetical protein
MAYIDNTGLEHESYEDACHYYGADTPAMLADEHKADEEEWLIEVQDRIEVGGPQFGAFRGFTTDDIPF